MKPHVFSTTMPHLGQQVATGCFQLPGIVRCRLWHLGCTRKFPQGAEHIQQQDHADCSRPLCRACRKGISTPEEPE